jgi:hypothetical protein
MRRSETIGDLHRVFDRFARRNGPRSSLSRSISFEQFHGDEGAPSCVPIS